MQANIKKPLIHSITSMLMNDNCLNGNVECDDISRKSRCNTDENNNHSFNDSIKENMSNLKL